MREPQAPSRPQRRVGVYERLGRADASPAKIIGITVMSLLSLIGLIIAFSW